MHRGRAWPTAQPGLRLRFAGWVSLSPSQTGLDLSPDFAREPLERSAQSTFIHKRPCLPRSGAGLGKVRGRHFCQGSHKLAAPTPWGFPCLLSRGRGPRSPAGSLFWSAPSRAQTAPALPNRGTETGPKRDAPSTSSCPTCPSAHHGTANADTALALPQAPGNPASTRGYCAHPADGETEAQACPSPLCHSTPAHLPPPPLK